MQKQAENLQELVRIVDEKNQFVKNCTRQEMRDNALTHQSTCIFLKNPIENKFYVHLRSKHKRWAPSCWTPCFGGVVGHDEDYDTNAEKEIEEEAGIKTELKGIDMFYFANEQQKVWSKMFIGYHNGQLNLQEEECEDYKLMSESEMIESFKIDNWAIDSTKAFFALINNENYKQL